MKPRHAFIACLICSGLIAQANAGNVGGDTLAGKGQQAGAGGLAAYLDPATGKLIDYPPYGKQGLQLTPDELNMFSTSDFGLIEHKHPDGSLSVNLQGRFRVGTMATLDEHGDLHFTSLDGAMFTSPTGRRIQRAVEEQPDSTYPGEER